jgi:hypothetical protein
MRTTLYLGLALTGLAATGCFTARESAPASFEHLAARNLTQEPVRWIDDCHFRQAAKASAEDAWKKIWAERCRQEPNLPYPENFARGFVEGYVDYLDAGGNGAPPRAAPFKYRLLKYKTPAGVQAAEAWFDGFRYGASVAQESGLRELILVPLSGPITAAVRPPLMPITPTRGPGSETSDRPDKTPTPPRTLPAPKPVEELPAPREEPDKDREPATLSVGPWRPAR